MSERLGEDRKDQKKEDHKSKKALRCFGLCLHRLLSSFPPDAARYLSLTRRDTEKEQPRKLSTTFRFSTPSGCLRASAMGEWTILERLLEAAVQQHSTMIGRWVQLSKSCYRTENKNKYLMCEIVFFRGHNIYYIFDCFNDKLTISPTE